MSNENRVVDVQNQLGKKYSKPQLLEYGRVEEITRGSQGSAIDGVFGVQPK